MADVVSRRTFLIGAAAAFVAHAARGQAPPADTAHGATMSGPMDGTAYLPVVLPAKAQGAAPLTQEERDDLEHKLKCQCGCVLDIYTCRTTDFTCPVSPAMHRDVLTLASTGYDAREIVIAFQAVYGERVLMAPVKEGFNLVGYALPSILIVGGGIAVFRWARKRSGALTPAVAGTPIAQATSDEIARIEAAVRTDE